MSAKLIIGADLVPTESNYLDFKEGNIKKLIGIELQEKLQNVDFTIFNLEVHLTDKSTPIAKCGPNLIAPTSTIKGLQAINPHFFTLANNHILDQGKQGLDSTIKTLEQAKIAYAGVGKNLEEARKPYIVQLNEIKVGIYCCAEHEFTIAMENKAGANPFDPLESLDDVEKLKEQCDYVIVLYHGGKEHYRYPSPYLQKVCRKLVDKGADLVVCQHSHCIGAEEDWKSGKIIYGQGNFLFDHSESEYWQTSLLLEIELNKKAESLNTSINYIPIQKKKEKVRIAQGDECNKIISEFQKRSKEILITETVERKYQEFAESMLYGYLNGFSGKAKRGLLYRIVNKISSYKFNKWHMEHQYNKNKKIILQNFIECEAHRELILKGLKGGKI